MTVFNPKAIIKHLMQYQLLLYTIFFELVMLNGIVSFYNKNKLQMKYNNKNKKYV